MKKIFKISVTFVLIFIIFSCGSAYRATRDRMVKNYNDGVSLYNQKKYNDAKDRFEDVISVDPEYKSAKSYLQKSKDQIQRKKKGEHSIAEQHYQKGVSAWQM